jgi:hypothetical protein
MDASHAFGSSRRGVVTPCAPRQCESLLDNSGTPSPHSADTCGQWQAERMAFSEQAAGRSEVILSSLPTAYVFISLDLALTFL